MQMKDLKGVVFEVIDSGYDRLLLEEYDTIRNTNVFYLVEVDDLVHDEHKPPMKVSQLSKKGK